MDLQNHNLSIDLLSKNLLDPSSGSYKNFSPHGLETDALDIIGIRLISDTQNSTLCDNFISNNKSVATAQRDNNGNHDLGCSPILDKLGPTYLKSRTCQVPESAREDLNSLLEDSPDNSSATPVNSSALASNSGSEENSSELETKSEATYHEESSNGERSPASAKASLDKTNSDVEYPDSASLSE